MFKAILSYKFVCSNLNEGKYDSRKWVLSHIRIVENIQPPYEDLDEGWYIDVDKRIAYFYTKNFEDKNELNTYAHSISPIDYNLDCYVRYEFSINEYDSMQECQNNLQDKSNSSSNRMVSKCLCKEGSTENCLDEVNKVLIEKLNNCIELKTKKVSSLKIIQGPNPV